MPTKYSVEQSVYQVIIELGKMHCARLFRYPVDIKINECPDYYEKITNPMDLNTLKFNFRNSKYKCLDDVCNDLHKIVDNCRIYNGAEHPIGRTTEMFEKCTRNKIIKLCQIYKTLGLSLSHSFQIDIKQLDEVDEKLHKKHINFIGAQQQPIDDMNDKLYYVRLSLLQPEDRIFLWLRDFIAFKASNPKNLSALVYMYRSNQFKSLEEIRTYMISLLNINDWAVFHIHFQQLQALVEQHQFTYEDETKQSCESNKESSDQIPQPPIQPKSPSKVLKIKIKIRKQKQLCQYQ